MKITVLFLCLMLTACGKGNGQSTITIQSPFSTRAPSLAIPQDVFQLASGIPFCIQNQIFLVTHDPVKNVILSQTPITLHTQTSTGAILCSDAGARVLVSAPSTNTDLAVTCLQAPDSYIDGPLQITAQDGIPVEIGIVGPYFDPHDSLIADIAAGSDGICDQPTGVAATTSRKAFTLFGHTLITPQQTTTVTLPVNILETNPVTAYTTLQLSSAISHSDWVQLDNLGVGFNLDSVAYLQNSDGSYAINQHVNGITKPVNFYVPNIFPFRLTFTDTSCPGAFFEYNVSGPNTGAITACKIGAVDCTSPCNFFNVLSYHITTY